MSQKAIIRVKINNEWVPVPMLVPDDEPVPVERTCVTVAKKGAMFDTINGAIEYAKTICDTNNRVQVVILDNSIYDEEITLLSNPGIDIAGFGAVIRHDSVYPHSPLYTTGRGTFTGLTFENYNQSTSPDVSYAMHFDYNNEGAQASGTTRFINCQFTAINCHGAGIGMGQNVELIFDNCYFRSTTHAGLYLHNSPFGGTSQVARFNSCHFVGADAANGHSIILDDAVTSPQSISSPMSVYLNACSFMPLAPQVISRNGEETTTYRGLVKTKNLSYDVQGSTLPHFVPIDLDDHTKTSYTYITTTNQNGHATIVKPGPSPAQTNITIVSCTVNDGTTITPTIVSDDGQMCAIISTDKPNAIIQLAVRVLPTGLLA